MTKIWIRLNNCNFGHIWQKNCRRLFSGKIWKLFCKSRKKVIFAAQWDKAIQTDRSSNLTFFRSESEKELKLNESDRDSGMQVL